MPISTVWLDFQRHDTSLWTAQSGYAQRYANILHQSQIICATSAAPIGKAVVEMMNERYFIQLKSFSVFTKEALVQNKIHTIFLRLYKTEIPEEGIILHLDEQILRYTSILIA